VKIKKKDLIQAYRQWNIDSVLPNKMLEEDLDKQSQEQAECLISYLKGLKKPDVL